RARRAHPARHRAQRHVVGALRHRGRSRVQRAALTRLRALLHPDRRLLGAGADPLGPRGRRRRRAAHAHAGGSGRARHHPALLRAASGRRRALAVLTSFSGMSDAPIALEVCVAGGISAMALSGARLGKHPIHPMLVVIPLGLWVTALVFDVVYAVTGNPSMRTAAFWNIGAGVVGALLAAIPGFVDWYGMTGRAGRLATYHMLLNLGAVALFAVNWLVRTRV